jgi:hypothetical protein
VAGDAERAAYARHLFRAEYGTAVERWRVALDVDARGTTLACMVEPGLVEDVTALGAATGFMPVSLRPHFACAQSALAARLGRADGWIAVLEEGYCTLALRQGGTWRDLAGMRVPEGGPDGAFFAAAIGARAWAVEAAGPVRTLHLIGWHGPAAAPRPGPDWQVHAWPDPHGFATARREAPLAA